MPRQNTWTNQDGLVVGFGTHSVDNNVPAVTSEKNNFKTAQITIVGTLVPLTPVIAPQSITIKRGSSIKRAWFAVTEAFVGASGVLNIGTYSLAGVVDDADGIDPIAIAEIDAIGEVVNCDGALVASESVTAGATSNSDVTIAFDYDTTAFSAGKGVLTVEYVEPYVSAVVAN